MLLLLLVQVAPRRGLFITVDSGVACQQRERGCKGQVWTRHCAPAAPAISVPLQCDSPLLASVALCYSLSSLNGVRVLGSLVLGMNAGSWSLVD